MSAPMISWRPAVGRIYRWLTTPSGSSNYTITLPSVPIHDIETTAEKRPRTLKHLLKANHSNYAIYFNSLKFHNHLPHHLGSSYLLGASVDQLHTIYVDEGKSLEPWDDAPSNITENEWRSFLGRKEYQRAYVDFFEDELALNHDYRWRDVVGVFLFEGKAPLIHALCGELGHPLIHLAYAYELDSREVAMEALAMTASSYTSLHRYLDDPVYTQPSTPNLASNSPLEILHKIHSDTRLNGLYDNHTGNQTANVIEDHEEIVLEYWNAWTLEDPMKDFEYSQEAAVALLVGTVPPEGHNYDFFLVHLLTTSHAIRVLLPLIPVRHHYNLVRQWWLLTVMTYIGQLRPQINEEWLSVDSQEPSKDWRYAEDKAVNGKWATDAHFVKAVRAIKEVAETWGDEEGRYRGAAVKFVDGFTGWTGFEVGHQGGGH